ncbi:hypothetical protein INP83_04760 [Mucilaginibacter sp. 21P]|uniref:hypothetical protein n=1 Tax=Mucilaginibacter sp. 21P TaxID=2778902 RepID=UPI001C584222|nr:hypothetical protein [Mucilaginibacter sp. 21P]QXV66398.1 hypothetical protein INP83_04760 [Mucilaginibacter sp. 21P]
MSNQSLSFKKTFLTIWLPAVFAVIGIWYGSNLNAKTERYNKLRDIRLQYETEAYQNLCYAIVYRGQHQQRLSALYLRKVAIAVQFFGTPEQIDLLHIQTKRIEERKGNDFTDLLNSLRNDLRKQFELPVESSDIQQVMIDSAVFDKADSAYFANYKKTSLSDANRK